jgi:uncharacterized membrane protein
MSAGVASFVALAIVVLFGAGAAVGRAMARGDGDQTVRRFAFAEAVVVAWRRADAKVVQDDRDNAAARVQVENDAKRAAEAAAKAAEVASAAAAASASASAQRPPPPKPGGKPKPAPKKTVKDEKKGGGDKDWWKKKF